MSAFGVGSSLDGPLVCEAPEVGYTRICVCEFSEETVHNLGLVLKEALFPIIQNSRIRELTQSRRDWQKPGEVVK